MKIFRILCAIISIHTLLFNNLAAQTIPESPTQTLDFTQVAKKAIPAVVSIKVTLNASSPFQSDDDSDQQFFGSDDFWKRFFHFRGGSSNQKEIGQGSGFIVSPTGTILTNNHIVKDAEKIEVTLVDGREFIGKVIGQDPNTDLAVIKIEGKELPYLSLGNSQDLEIGQWVAAIGNSFGLQATLTVGVVSAKDRNNLGLAQIEDFIQTDAAINRGNSGGPLLNLKGEVIGINTAIVSSSGGNMGIGFAIPSSLALAVLDQLLKDGSVTRGYVGVVLQTIDQDLANAFGIDKPQGALVTEVAKDSPAEKAGIQVGDIILKYDGNPIQNLGVFRNAVSFLKPGSTLKLDILRDKKNREIVLNVAKFPENASLAQHVPSTNSKLGIQVESLTKENQKNFSLDVEKGVVVTKVDPAGLGSYAGIKTGSVILEVNKQKISTPDEFNQAIQKTESGKSLLLLIKQGSITRFVSIKSE